jgi:hypothetical protein
VAVILSPTLIGDVAPGAVMKVAKVESTVPSIVAK